MPRPLSIIESCEGCGACCRVVTQPPFVRRLDGEGEEAWERLRWDHPELLAAILEQERERKQSGAPSFGTPCLWFDATLGRCRHYDYRPRACREFALGGVDCHDARRRAGLASP
ncbi:YkgJ family cysteine cluster protein [Singulisphaera rosea]